MASPEICLVDGCDKHILVISRRLCRAHYKRWYKYGDANAPVRKQYSYEGRQCAAEGCGKRPRRNGHCDTHSAAIKRRDKPEQHAKVMANAKARYWEKREALLGRPRPMFCELCGEPPYPRMKRPRSGMCFDHCHATGKPRGWLCDRCNKVLGMVKDSPAILRKLAAYLEKHANGETESRYAQGDAEERLCREGQELSD